MEMNHGWRNTVIIISVVFLQILPLFSQASPINQVNGTSIGGKKSFVTDWQIRNNYSQLISSEPHLKPLTSPSEENDYVKLNMLAEGPANTPWPMLSHDNVHSGRSQFSTLTNSGKELWQIHGQKSGEVWSSPIIDKNGTIYFCTQGGDSSLYAVYQNETIKWRYHASPMWSTPAIAEDGTIYLGAGTFTALWPNGTEKWLFFSGVTTYSPAIGSDGTIYFGSDNTSGKGPIYALDPDGTQKWVFITNNTVMGGPALGNDGTIYIGSGDYNFYALNPNGTLRWRYHTGGYIKGSASIAFDGTIYVPSFDGYLYAFHPDGTLYWRSWTGGSISAAGVALAADGTIYVGTDQLRAFSPNGTLKWSADVHGDIVATVPAVSSDGTIFITAGSNLSAVNPDGTVKWISQISNEQSHSSPCIGSNSCVYVGSRYRDYGYLHAFGPGEPQNIELIEPKEGHFYWSNHDYGLTPRGKTIIIGSAIFSLNISDQQDLINVSFNFQGQQVSLTNPPFQWTMNQRYGKSLIKDSVSIIAYYKGGVTRTISMPVVYFHLL